MPSGSQREVHRTTFTRQMANLWVARERLWQYLLLRMSFDSQISLVDSFPVPTCRFARAYRQACPEWLRLQRDEQTDLLRLAGAPAGLLAMSDLRLEPRSGRRPRTLGGRGTARRGKGMGLGRQELLEPTVHRAARRAGFGPAGALQVQKAGEGALAPLFSAKASQDQDGDRATGGALPGREVQSVATFDDQSKARTSLTSF